MKKPFKIIDTETGVVEYTGETPTTFKGQDMSKSIIELEEENWKLREEKDHIIYSFEHLIGISKKYKDFEAVNHYKRALKIVKGEKA